MKRIGRWMTRGIISLGLVGVCGLPVHAEWILVADGEARAPIVVFENAQKG